MYRAAVDRLLDLCFPPDCLLCGLPARAARCCAACRAARCCAACRADLPWIRRGCPICARPLAAGGAAACPGCAPGSLDGSFAALVYEYPVSALIAQLKYAGRTDVGRGLGELLADALGSAGWDRPADCIVPVPLHPARERERGYNQAEEIAAPIARRLGLSLGARLCRRLVDTPRQTGLSATQRANNLAGAFSASRLVSGACIAVVDDVLTTGATARALASALRRAGAREVRLWAVARTVRRVRGTSGPAGCP